MIFDILRILGFSVGVAILLGARAPGGVAETNLAIALAVASVVFAGVGRWPRPRPGFTALSFGAVLGLILVPAKPEAFLGHLPASVTAVVGATALLVLYVRNSAAPLLEPQSSFTVVVRTLLRAAPALVLVLCFLLSLTVFLSILPSRIGAVYELQSPFGVAMPLLAAILVPCLLGTLFSALARREAPPPARELHASVEVAP